MTLTALPPATDSMQALRTAPAQLRRKLRPREVRLLAFLATGAPMTVLAQMLGVSDRTVRRRLRLLCEEIGVRTPIEAVVWATRQRLI